MATRCVSIFGGCDHNNLLVRGVMKEEERWKRTSGPISKRANIAARAVSSFTILIPSIFRSHLDHKEAHTTQELSFELVWCDHVSTEVQTIDETEKLCELLTEELLWSGKCLPGQEEHNICHCLLTLDHRHS